MKQSDIMLELVRSGARPAVLFSRYDLFDPEKVGDLYVTRTRRGYIVTKEDYNIAANVTHKELAYLLGMIYKKGNKFNNYFEKRVGCNISTLDGIHLHAEIHLESYVSEKELTSHTIAMVDKFNAVLRPKGIECTYRIRRNKGVISRYNTLVVGDRLSFLANFEYYHNDLSNYDRNFRKTPIYDALINMDFDELEHFYRNNILGVKHM